MKYFYLSFDSEFFDHINDMREAEGHDRSKIFQFTSDILKLKIVSLPLKVFEFFVAFIFWLPIPIYSSILYRIVTQSRGLPFYHGMYLRSLYYRFRLAKMSPNVFIEQNVFFAFPKSIILEKFCYIDKNCIIMSDGVHIGERVHICPNVFISGGGQFVANDFSCVCANSQIITSSERLKNGSRASGPMAKPAERLVIRGHVTVDRDAFVGVGSIILPNVIVAEGSVIAAGATITKSTEPWSITASAKNNVLGYRERVKY